MDTDTQETLQDRYAYSPLPTADSFRVLELHPGSHETPLAVSLHATNHRDSPYYEALSYVWGDSNHKRSISCDGKTIFVTDNLYEALHGLRDRSQIKVMWIDAICICQEDLAERSQQVAIMGTIYARAVKTKVWLERESPATVRGLDLIEFIAEECRKYGISVCLNDSSKGVAALIKNVEKLRSHIDGRLKDMQEPWADLEAVLSSAWFKRVWIIQEITLSVEADAHFGSHHVPWSSLILFSFWYSRASWALLNKTTSQNSAVWYDPLRPLDLATCQVEESIARLLNYTRTFQCADPRDKVYGLLAMPAFCRLQPPITADYTLSIREVYMLASARAIEELYDLDILTYGRQLSHAPTWPSWVPAWTESSAWKPVCYEADWCLRAAQIAHLTSEAPPTIDPDTNTLQATGCLLGMIKVCSAKITLNDIVPWQWPIHRVIVPSAQQLHARFQTQCTPHREDQPVNGDSASTFFGTTSNDIQQVYLTITAGNLFGRDRLNNTAPDISRMDDLKELTRTMSHLQDVSPDDRQEDITRVVLQYSAKNKLFLIEDNRLGLCPQETKPGDFAVFIYGCRAPLVLRPRGDQYTIIGPCYIYDYMHGKDFSKLHSNEKRRFTIC